MRTQVQAEAKLSSVPWPSVRNPVPKVQPLPHRGPLPLAGGAPVRHGQEMASSWLRLCARTQRASSWQGLRGPEWMSPRGCPGLHCCCHCPPRLAYLGLPQERSWAVLGSSEGEPAGGPVVSVAKAGWSPVEGRRTGWRPTPDPLRGLLEVEQAPRGEGDSPPLRTRSLGGLERAPGLVGRHCLTQELGAGGSHRALLPALGHSS